PSLSASPIRECPPPSRNLSPCPGTTSCSASCNTSRACPAPTQMQQRTARQTRPLSARHAGTRASASGAADFAVPPLEQPLALGGRSILGKVVVDELDVRRLRRKRRHRRV